MLFGVVVWVALAVFVPTVVVPTVQHAVQPSGPQAAPDARPAGAPRRRARRAAGERAVERGRLTRTRRLVTPTLGGSRRNATRHVASIIRMAIGLGEFPAHRVIHPRAHRTAAASRHRIRPQDLEQSPRRALPAVSLRVFATQYA